MNPLQSATDGTTQGVLGASSTLSTSVSMEASSTQRNAHGNDAVAATAAQAVLGAGVETVGGGTPSSAVSATACVPAASAAPTVSVGGGSARGSTAMNPFAQNITRTSPATVVWLHENYEAAEGVSLGRSTLYQHYTDHCNRLGQEPVNAASFGKLIRSVFPNLKTRRLGTRGNSKYHYYGITVKQESTLHFEPDQVGGPHQRIRGRDATGVDDKGKSAGGVGTAAKSGTAGAATGDSAGAATTPGLDSFFDLTVELPVFPPMLRAGGVVDSSSDFSKPYHAHLKDVLKTLCQANFSAVMEKWSQFWGVIAAHFRDMLGTPQGIEHVDRCDAIFFDTLGTALFTDVLCNMPEDLTKEIRYFAKCMEPWMKTALEGYPDVLVAKKVVRVRAFAHALRRYTSLNHLAQAAANVLRDTAQTQQMLRDIECIDFRAAMAQAEPVCQCRPETVRRIESEMKWALENNFTMRQWASWLQSTVRAASINDKSGVSPQKRSRAFLTRWSFYSSIVIRDLTLRSAASFGSFHLMRLLYDEYILYLVEIMDAKGAGVLEHVPAGCTRATAVPFPTRDGQQKTGSASASASLPPPATPLATEEAPKSTKTTTRPPNASTPPVAMATTIGAGVNNAASSITVTASNVTPTVKVEPPGNPAAHTGAGTAAKPTAAQ
eukprot:m.1323324 g.1323324  ORF g.1323324 m.1323324 type:complete len:663 (+) comp24849_c0_seq2:191-2179(+)